MCVTSIVTESSGTSEGSYTVLYANNVVNDISPSDRHPRSLEVMLYIHLACVWLAVSGLTYFALCCTGKTDGYF